jgi:signal transduction histidine kinase
VVDVRRVVEGLRPPALDELGLAGAIDELAAKLAPHIPDGINIDVSAHLPCLSAAVEVAAYRVVSEALTNVVRHARASSCRVNVHHEHDSLRIEVSDDGCGIAAPRPGGAGLATMRERAEELGGEVAIDAERLRGTTVRIRLPATATPRIPSPPPLQEARVP